MHNIKSAALSRWVKNLENPDLSTCTLKGLILNEKKPQEYAALKIPECWQVDPIKNQVTAEQVLLA